MFAALKQWYWTHTCIRCGKFTLSAKYYCAKCYEETTCHCNQCQNVNDDSDAGYELDDNGYPLDGN